MELLRSLPPLPRDSLLALGLVSVLTGLGHRSLRLVRAPRLSLSRLEWGFISASLGVGLIQYLPLGLAAFRCLSETTARVATGGLALLLLPDLVHLIRRVSAAAWAARGWRPTGWVAVWLATALVFLGALAIRSMVVGGLVEDDGYHLTAPKRWLHAGALDYLPTYTHTNAPMGFEMLYTIALALGGPTLAQLLHLVAGLFCFLGVFLVARRLGHPAAGLLVIACLLFENPFFDVPVLLNQAYVDLAVCWLMTAALLLWQVWCIEEDRRWLAASALCAGFAASFKFTALSMGAALILLVLLHLRRRGLGGRRAAVPLASAALLSLAPILPWLWRNGRLTGNPLYPMLSGVIPTRDWSQAHARVFTTFFRLYNWLIWRPLTEQQRKEILLASAAAVVAAFAFGLWRVRRPAPRDLLVFAAVLTLPLLATTGLYFRFLLPSIICALLVAACVAASRLRSGRVLQLATLVLVLALAKWGNWARRDLPDALRVVTGLAPERRDDSFHDVWRHINTSTPPEAHVLIAAFCASYLRTQGMAFWVDRATYTTDSHVQDFISCEDWPLFLEGIKKARIQYVVLADLPSPMDRPICSPAAFFAGGRNEYPFSRRLADEHGTRIYRSGPLAVYQLDDKWAAQR